jgi:glycosyltransferase involved in cell wall biosynthesis
MKTKNKVAVIMAVYNTPFDIIKRAIDSVLNQTFQDFELLIIDDGSSTDSYKLILEYSGCEFYF